jgi:uncharacterized membrane protein
MTRPPRDDHGTHALIEHYTPDGTLGRLLFGLVVGAVAMLLSWIGAVGLVSGQPLGFLVGVPSVGFGLVSAAVALAALWPVYLSLIGNLDSPETYAVGEGLETPEADPEAILQRRYAEGEISRETFERRLDDLLAADADRRVSGGGRRSGEPNDPRDDESDDAPGERVTAADAPETDDLRAARERARSRRTGAERGGAGDDHDTASAGRDDSTGVGRDDGPTTGRDRTEPEASRES